MPRLLQILTTWLVLGASTSFGAPPKLNALFPAGGKAGSTIEVRALGEFASWPVESWCENERIAIEAGGKKGMLKVTIGNDAAAGPCLVRLFTAEGASQARPFVVGNDREISESAPNNRHSSAEAIGALPVTVNGRLEKRGDTDFFKVDLKEGDLLAASLDGYSLGSAIDPFLHAYDPRGHEVAVASDSHNLDPRLTWRARETGVHFIQVFAIGHKADANVHYAGSEPAVYRLTLSLGEPQLSRPVADLQESDDAAADGQLIEIPATVAGQLRAVGETDLYRFNARKNDSLLVRVEAHRHHLPTDPRFVIKKPDGTILLEADDAKTSRDPEALVKIPEDGEYSLRIADLFRRGGEPFHYRLVVAPPEPGVGVTIEKSVHLVRAGERVELKLKIDRRHGHKGDLLIQALDLPAGLSVEEAEIGAEAKEATIKLAASAEAAPTNQPFTLVALEGVDRGEPAVKHSVTHSFQTAESRGDYLVNETTRLWVTVTPAGEPAEPVEKDAN